MQGCTLASEELSARSEHHAGSAPFDSSPAHSLREGMGWEVLSLELPQPCSLLQPGQQGLQGKGSEFSLPASAPICRGACGERGWGLPPATTDSFQLVEGWGWGEGPFQESSGRFLGVPSVASVERL